MRERGAKEEASHELKNFLSEFPDHANGQNDLGCYYDELGKKAVAIDCFTNALTANPENTPSRLNLIRLLCDTGRYPESTPHLEYLAKSGLNIVVSAKDNRATIILNGKTFYDAPLIT